VPKGFAHGFVVLSDEATVSYKCDVFYSPENESGIYFADPTLAIDWRVPANQIIVSDKDKKYATFREVSANEKNIGHWR
jgi:dTDP-4-dehydrorhamnose 3,5-epimerase